MLTRVATGPLRLGDRVYKYLFKSPDCYLRGSVIRIDDSEVEVDCGDKVFAFNPCDIEVFRSSDRADHFATLADGKVIQRYVESSDPVPDEFLDLFRQLDLIS